MKLMYAVARHPGYREEVDKVKGLPEARMLKAIGKEWFGLHVHDAQSDGTVVKVQGQGHGFTVLMEDESTNCGDNAFGSRAVLEAYGVHSPRSTIVAQDPTMCRRTVASFAKVCADKTGSEVLRLLS